MTDAWFTYDVERLRALGRLPTLVEGENAVPPPRRFDAVVALPPSDIATQVAMDHGVPLVACVTKKHDMTHPALTVSPPPGTSLWHAFARTTWGALHLLGAAHGCWAARGAPFPVNRYYFPRTNAAPVRHVLLFGTKLRDLDLAFAASRAAGEARIAVLGNHADRDAVLRGAAAHGLGVDWWAQLDHEEMLRLHESCAIVVNPITTESHYSLSLPLALGRPVLATSSVSASVFYDPERRGMQLLPAGDVGAWAAAIAALRDPTAWQRASDDAAARAATHHDAERFFASAILNTVATGPGNSPT